MFCQEKDVDDDYIEQRYDLTMLLRNLGGSGGLRLVSDGFFDWGMKAMLFVSKELTIDDVERLGERAFGKAKKATLGHPNLRSDFACLVQRQQHRDPRIETSYNLSSEIYSEIMEKVCNARFNETMDNYNEKQGLVGKGALGIRRKSF